LAALHAADWDSRFNSLWLLPGILENPDDPAADRARRYLVNAVVEDLVHGQPDLLIVSASRPHGVSGEFNYLSYFAADERFRGLLDQYERVGVTDNYVLLGRRRPD
jgi:hypothetical protein